MAERYEPRLAGRSATPLRMPEEALDGALDRLREARAAFVRKQAKGAGHAHVKGKQQPALAGSKTKRSHDDGGGGKSGKRPRMH